MEECFLKGQIILTFHCRICAITKKDHHKVMNRSVVNKVKKILQIVWYEEKKIILPKKNFPHANEKKVRVYKQYQWCAKHTHTVHGRVHWKNDEVNATQHITRFVDGNLTFTRWALIFFIETEWIMENHQC